jgi:hypothetical protein
VNTRDPNELFPRIDTPTVVARWGKFVSPSDPNRGCVTTKYLVKTLCAALAGGALALAAVPFTSANATESGGVPGKSLGFAPPPGVSESVCPAPSPGYAACFAEVFNPGSQKSNVPPFTHTAKGPTGAATGASIEGLSPANVQGVYGFPTSLTAGSSETIAIVDAYNDPNAAADLATFSNQWGLPACGNGCFTQVNESGGPTLPANNANWALEISLDIEWAHAIAPGANILLVEAASNSLAHLMDAEQYAGAHANYVSNSWGGGELSTESSYDSDFSGTTSYFAASGDTAGQLSYPAVSPRVVTVGGTSLTITSGGAFTSESVWSNSYGGSGGGCSAYEPTPAAQSSFAQYAQSGCTTRAVPDVSLDADPSSGVAVYDSFQQSSPWIEVGGTSVGTPIWAAASATTGSRVDLATVYNGSAANFRDITQGNNGHPALVGYDLATGRGSWASVTPAPVTSLVASKGSPGVSLSWGGGGGADTFDVFRGATPSTVSTTPVATGVTGDNYNDPNVAAGVPYYYEVEGVNSQGNGSPSNEVNVTPTTGNGSPGAPPAPKGFTATYKAGTGVVLKWNAATGAKSYDILRGTSSGGETLYASGITTRKYVDKTANPTSTDYYYEVDAVNASGPGPVSTEASVGPAALQASISKSCSSASCSFTSVSTDSGGTITTYAWTSTTGTSGSSSSFNVTFSAKGSYKISLAVTDSNNASANTSVTVSCVHKKGVGLVCS